MQAPQEGLNPLRPYYIAPSIGTSGEPPANATAAHPKFNGKSVSGFTLPGIDYAEYLSEASPSVTSSVKDFLDQALWKYASVLMAQPFEVAKIILQVHVAQDKDDEGAIGADAYPARGIGQQHYEDDDSNSSDDEPNYFTSAAPVESPSTPMIRGRKGNPQRLDSDGAWKQSTTSSQNGPNQISLKNPHSVLDTLSALSSNSGPLSLWRASNTTFIYSLLSRTFESFFRSFLGAIFGLSDSDILTPVTSGAIPDSSILSSASPTATVLISTAATVMAALLLAPIDAARTRLILTPSSREPRTLLATLRTLSPSYLIPGHIVPITFFTSAIPVLVSSSTPLFIRSYLKLEPYQNPTSWSIATFLGSAVDLSIRFPLETVLRRAQIVTWTSPAFAPPSSSSKRKAFDTIIPVPQSYRGILPTMWSIMREEGYSEPYMDRAAAAAGKAPRKRRKGQGIEGLYRGWRVGLWGLVGVWGASFVGGLQLNGEALPTEASGLHGRKF